MKNNKVIEGYVHKNIDINTLLIYSDFHEGLYIGGTIYKNSFKNISKKIRITIEQVEEE